MGRGGGRPSIAQHDRKCNADPAIASPVKPRRIPLTCGLSEHNFRQLRARTDVSYCLWCTNYRVSSCLPGASGPTWPGRPRAD